MKKTKKRPEAVIQDRELIDAAADRLNREALDTLEYQFSNAIEDVDADGALTPAP